MKRCPECRRDYYDDSLLYCLDDGTALLEGPSSTPGREEPRTELLRDAGVSDEAATKAQLHATDAPPSGVRKGAPVAKFAIVAVLGLLILLGLGFFAYRYFRESPQINSIAIMPFVNESGNPDVDYLSDGMTETLISSLSQVPNLDVKPRSSVFRYKGKETDPQTIGKELNVQAVLNGRVTQRGQDIAVYVELIDTSRDKTLWSDTYNRKQSDLVTLQSELARDVSGKLRSKLAGSDEAKITKTYTTDPEAYQLYLKGNYYRTKYNEEGYKKGIEYYQKALQKDPNYALPYEGIARAYNTASEWYLPPSDANPKAKAAAQKALELDPTLADAHRTLASIEFWYDWDWVAVEEESKRASELDGTPQSPPDFYYVAMGRFDDAARSAQTAVERLPLDLQVNADLADIYVFAGRYDDAIVQARKTLEIDQNYWLALEALGVAFEQKKQFPEAIQALEHARAVDVNPEILGYLGHLYALAGKRAEAQKVLDDLNNLSKDRYVSPYYFAMVYGGLGDKDQAFAWLEKAFVVRSSNMPLMRHDLGMDEIRADPRFQDLVKRVGLP